MILYWLLFAVVAGGALQFAKRQGLTDSRAPFLLVSGVIALIIGLRYEVGGDWGAYIRTYEQIYFLEFTDALDQTDIGYAFLNWAAAQADAGIWLVNFACAVLFMTGVGKLCLKQPNPFLALLVAVPYLIIVVAMGYTRQAAAIGLICLGLSANDPKRTIKVFVAIAAATLMHKSAILALPIVLVPLLRTSLITAVLGAALFAFSAYVAFIDSADTMMTNYVEGEYDSEGALVRVLMNVLCGALFLKYRRLFGFDNFHSNYWTMCSLLSLACLAGLFILPSSSGIDRVALFLIPLQIVVLGRLPYLRDPSRASPEILAGVVAYSALVQLVWLTSADHAEYWLPYQSVVEGWLST